MDNKVKKTDKPMKDKVAKKPKSTTKGERQSR